MPGMLSEISVPTVDLLAPEPVRTIARDGPFAEKRRPSSSSTAPRRDLIYGPEERGDLAAARGFLRTGANA